jgi:cytochrome c biogenesis protein CcmG, thiol:disulfide interchange protein DsbE
MTRSARHRPAHAHAPGRSVRAPRPDSARTTSPGIDGRLLLGLGALVLIVAAGAAVILTSSPSGAGGTSAAPSRIAAPTLASGAALPAFADPMSDPAVGLAVPEAAGSSFDGTPVRIAADGRSKILLFLAHWCPHCQAEVPVVQRWLDEGRLPSGVDLISIATSIDANRPNFPPDAWLAREGWEAPVLVDPDDAVAQRFGLSAFPFWVVADADGRVVMRLTGELSPDQLDALAAAVAR